MHLMKQILTDIKVQGVDLEYNNSPDITPDDPDHKLYASSQETINQEKLNNILIIQQQLLQQKKGLLDQIEETFLFPYLIDSTLLVGKIEGIEFTESVDSLIPYINKKDGIREVLKLDITKDHFYDWDVFRIITPIKSRAQDVIILQIPSYIVLHIKSNQINFFAFTIYNEKILDQQATFKLLDSNPKIAYLKQLIAESQADKEDQA